MKRRLGRGLDSLLSPTRYETVESAPEEPVVAPAVTTPTEEKTVSDKPVNIASAPANGELINELPLAAIQTNPHQPRLNWDLAKLNELAESIRQNGLVQPIIVRAHGNGYQLIAGERRMRASEIAGYKTIKAIVKSATEEQMLEWALIENIQRDDLSPMERAKAYHNYIS
ncbi:MAG: ParB/RepB/Spo0J family partition protein, partial [Sedimentisphaerales bacterium]|nr:ParB/RepB/Spo0J family partition protein [Sedimentisphaerales bacterium]